MTTAQVVRSNLTLTIASGTLVATVNGGSSGDSLIGNGADNTLNGNSGNDTLRGAAGIDSLNGGTDNDTLLGGLGNDVLTGGSGIDRFLYDSSAAFTATAIGLDTLTDFLVGTDKIVLDKTTFTALTSAVGNGFSESGEFAAVTTDAAAATSTARIVYNRSNGRLFYNQNGSTAGFGTGAQFASLSGNPTLAAADFVIQA